jgi:hypothetical protein
MSMLKKNEKGTQNDNVSENSSNIGTKETIRTFNSF